MGFVSFSVLNGSINYVRWSNRFRCLASTDFPAADYSKGFFFEFHSTKLKMTEKYLYRISLMQDFRLAQA